MVARTEDPHAIVILEVFEVASTRHAKFRMPVLLRRHGEPSYLLLKSLVMFTHTDSVRIGAADPNFVIQDIRFAFNAQHDCKSAGCTATGVREVLQERVESGRTENFIQHKDIHRYVINLHSLHNPHLIREILPRQLTAPIARAEEIRRDQHDQNATMLRVERTRKTAAAKAKRAKKVTDAAQKHLTADVPPGEPDRPDLERCMGETDRESGKSPVSASNLETSGSYAKKRKRVE